MEADSIAFVSPVFGKSLDITYPFIPQIKQAIEDEKLSPADRGLMDIGGFVFYKGDKIVSVHSMLPGGGGEKIVSIKPQKTIPGDQDRDVQALKQEIAKLDNPEGLDQYNTCRITLGPLLPFASHFAFINGRFIYKNHFDEYFALNV